MMKCQFVSGVKINLINLEGNIIVDSVVMCFVVSVVMKRYVFCKNCKELQ